MIKAKALHPRYVLRIDDLPKVCEADGQVWPIYLTLTDTCRMFNVSRSTLRSWIIEYKFPAFKLGPHIYVAIGELNEWLLSHAINTIEETE